MMAAGITMASELAMQGSASLPLPVRTRRSVAVEVEVNG